LFGSSRDFLVVVDFLHLLLFSAEDPHLVPVKPPLPEEAIFKHNQAAVDRRRAEHKKQNKEKEIAKCDQNDERIVNDPYNKDSTVKTSSSRGVYTKFHAHFYY
jgi:hypothetical protein